MSIIQLFALAIRVVGVYWLFLAVMQIGFYGLATMHLEAILVDGGTMYDIAQLAWSSVYILVTILMIIFPVKLAQWLIPGKVNHTNSEDLPVERLILSALVVAGVIIVAQAIPNVVNSGVWLWYTTSGQVNNRLVPGSSAEYMIGILTAVVELAIGLYLMFGAQGLQKMMSKFRRLGVE